MQVLVIDDSKAVRSILAKMLRELEFDVVEAANGQDALERLREIGSVDLATVNWNMPKMDGLEFIQMVRADPSFAQMKLLVVSGESAEATRDRALAEGANDYLEKPVTKSTLVKKLAELEIVAPAQSVTSGPSCSAERSDAPTVSSTPTLAAPLRVLIVDDSVVVRGVIASLLGEDPDLVVVATAADGRQALRKLPQAKPDVLLLDIEMPVMDGFETLKALRDRDSQLPVIMFSSLTERGAAATLDALLLGANDYVSKPGGTAMRDAEAGRRAIREELIPKIKQFGARQTPRATGADAPPAPAHGPMVRQRIDVVAVAVSTGGPKALSQLLPTFVSRCPVPVLIVQHMPPMFTSHLAKRLSSDFDMHVTEAQEGQQLEPGNVYIAPGGRHMCVKRFGSLVRVVLNNDPPVNACRPSADVLFHSVAKVYGAGSLSVVLTGMGNDGLAGCRRLHELGGRIVVQDEQTSVVWGMPGHVARAGLADKILPLDRLGAEIARRVSEQR
jgi:two-component system chemotaxis response regulator CheB